MSLDKEMDPIITVNIGNRQFSSHKKVLEKSLYFVGLFNFYSNSKTDYSDHFIDRDPDIFSYLLNCLRDPNYIDVQKLINYNPDITYYQIESFLSLIEEKKKTSDNSIKFSVTKLSNEVKYDITDSIITIRYDPDNHPYELDALPGRAFTIKTGLKITIPTNCIGLLSISPTNQSGILLIDQIYPSKTYDNFEISVHYLDPWSYLDLTFYLHIVQLQKL